LGTVAVGASQPAGLDRDVSEEEIHTAVMKGAPEKAPDQMDIYVPSIKSVGT
jgi:hypothetical protein